MLHHRNTEVYPAKAGDPDAAVLQAGQEHRIPLIRIPNPQIQTFCQSGTPTEGGQEITNALLYQLSYFGENRLTE